MIRVYDSWIIHFWLFGIIASFHFLQNVGCNRRKFFPYFELQIFAMIVEIGEKPIFVCAVIKWFRHLNIHYANEAWSQAFSAKIYESTGNFVHPTLWKNLGRESATISSRTGDGGATTLKKRTNKQNKNLRSRILYLTVSQ